MKFLTGLWLLLMLILSHIPGEPSGEESKWLSWMTGVDESLLRRAAHIVVYLVLTVLVNVSFSDLQSWIRIAVLMVIAVVDETSKALPIFPGRHCSIGEMGLNCVGVGIGALISIFL